MSMLAEPRRKQKWSVDPRNSAWSNDDSKFGQKMLERMGWSKGKGLGKSEQGATDHIKVKVKNDSYGLGANASCEDNWIAHQDDFNELLAQLNNCHGQNNGNSNEPAPDEQKGFSLEEKSKTSKKRVHYMKFAKGKDLSSRSETDLNCIFGKRARPAKDQEQESNSSDSQGEVEEKGTPAASELDTESITKTVTSTLSMQEYFAQRMAQLKKARGQAPSATSPVEAETNETSGASEEPSPIHSSNHESEEPKKKKKKKKKAVGEVEVVDDTSSAPIVEKDDENQEQESSKKKKKKKRKMAENERATGENCSSTSGVEQNCEELPPSKKKKLKKHNEETELLNGHEPSEDQIVESEVVQKKKQKQKEELGDVVEEKEVVEKKSKKDKKKKKKHQE
ncbi:PIN2/TERF1-interacting telomerase inhibitor 1 isoform X2 [Toxotes jaculatrix]|uniref:PIN2/TERF1-interacting telomerase inhibitor 1 isoform X2 n=1 Tax=Toxotes jaculatrix TaxID=941984 RepID=UPI001B3A90F8|nr:PIN2/TERF1-interacting telomerase inhibitor 1 isoform X2 [Toxotes jaculatrix]